MTTARITCTCKTCTANGNGRILAATAPTSLLEALGVTTSTSRSSKSAIHGLVYDANAPGAISAAVRTRLNIAAA